VDRDAHFARAIEQHIDQIRIKIDQRPLGPLQDGHFPRTRTPADMSEFHGDKAAPDEDDTLRFFG
jgi:hypothetical protein